MLPGMTASCRACRPSVATWYGVPVRSRGVFSRSPRDAALAAIQVFNNPLITFKSETFIVLMNIAWTHLLHAYYRRNDVERGRFRPFRQVANTP
jgi:hypothetical protein